MSSFIEAHEHQGYRVELHRDDCCDDPRDWDGSFLWLGFKHRRYEFGDEQVDPTEVEIPCAECGGKGYDDDRHPGNCESCCGFGSRQADTLQEACAQLAKERGALHWEYVACLDHSGLSFSLGRPTDPWDSGYAGIILVTAEMAAEWGCNPENDPAEWHRQMAAEIEMYDRWQREGGYGYRVLDRDRDEVDSCWGFYDEDDCIEQAHAYIGDDVAPPKSPDPVRLTHADIARVQAWIDDRVRLAALEDRGGARCEWHGSDDDAAEIVTMLASKLGLTAHDPEEGTEP